VQEQPQDAEHRRVLAAAEYRLGDCRAALESLERSADLKRGQDGFDLLLLALCHAELGQRQQADELYGEAIRWLDHNPCDAELLASLRQEAEIALRTGHAPAAN
jgi:tetratricopeptide (TPR) repeat protein